MRINKKALLKALLAVSAIATPIIYAYEYGPDPAFSGAPGDNANGCEAASCHVGTPNTGGGSVTITASGGTTYVPGVAQTISVKVTDAAKRRYGFQLSARLDSDPKNKPGGVVTAGADGNTQVLCLNGSPSPAAGCPASSGSTLQWVEHSQAGYGKSNTPPSSTFTFNWTPPAAGSGPVTMYAAGNAVTGALVVTGTNNYLSKLTLTPTTGPAPNPNAPTITSGGIVPVYSSSSTIQPGSWVSIFGTNLASASTEWKGDFPTTLGGTSVTVNSKPAYLWFVSPTQINFQAPDDTGTGSVPVVVTTANGTVTSTVTLGVVGPSFSLLDGKHVTGIIARTDGSGAFGGGGYDIIGPAGTSLGYKTVPAKAGDTILLFGVGFGPTDPPVPAGKAFASAAKVTSQLQILINNKPVTPAFAGMTQAGLYQFNITLPTGLGTGEVPLQATVAGAQTQSTTVINLQ